MISMGEGCGWRNHMAELVAGAAKWYGKRSRLDTKIEFIERLGANRTA